MLSRLSVENYALIRKLDIGFSPSLNIITGETGAGKSILLGALGLLVGNRCDVSVLKDKGKNCVVEGVFSMEGLELEDFFEDHDLDYDPATIIRRVISPNGKSRAYVNDLPVQVTTLKELGLKLIDIHSQYQTLAVSEESFRTEILDSVAGNRKLVDQYGTVYHRIRSGEKELGRLKELSQSNARDAEWLEYQVEELDKAGLGNDDPAENDARLAELTHAEEIRQVLSNASYELDRDEEGILPKTKALLNNIRSLSDFYNRSGEFSGRLESIYIELKELCREISSESERVDSDPSELERLTNRADLLNSLMHKHKASDIGELTAIRDSYAARLANITGYGERIAQLEKELTANHKEAGDLASELSAKRTEAGISLSAEVVNLLGQLGMPKAVFRVEIAPSADLKPSGRDDIRFLFSAVSDTDASPVEKTASGGELSRVMLALKSILARNKKLPTIIFDEIDTGVSGQIADAMGRIIEGLSQNMQVINITHLPQVASKGGTHYCVRKATEDGETTTLIDALEEGERVSEIAKMLSGDTVTDAAIRQAEILLGKR